MADGSCPDQRQNNEIVLLALEFIDGIYFVGLPEHRILRTTFRNNVANQMLLAVVSRQNADLFRRISEHSHVHKNCNCKFRFGQVLQKNFQFQMRSILRPPKLKSALRLPKLKSALKSPKKSRSLSPKTEVHPGPRS